MHEWYHTRRATEILGPYRQRQKASSLRAESGKCHVAGRREDVRDWLAVDRGRRLDHVWVTHDLKGALHRHAILKEARGWPQASDHVPVCVELNL